MSTLDIARRALAKLKGRSESTAPDSIARERADSHKREEESDRSDQADWWEVLTPEEREVLKPRPIRLRCPWCKHIEHTAICNELRPKRLMPLGKYKGHAIEDLPVDYVHWLAAAKVRLDPDIRDEIYDRFGVAIQHLRR